MQHACYESRKVSKAPKLGPNTPSLAQWETFEFDPEHWSQLLRDIGADEASRRDVFLLCQYGSKGALAANGVIHKVLKKIQDDVDVTNWSAFIHKVCLHERQRIQSEAQDSQPWKQQQRW